MSFMDNTFNSNSILLECRVYLSTFGVPRLKSFRISIATAFVLLEGFRHVTVKATNANIVLVQ